MVTRGLRNNNPFNIRYVKENLWKGKVPDEKKRDSDFEEFISLPYGIRAGYLLLRKYIHDGDDTIRKIITRWAPPEDGNNTIAYIDYIEHCMFLPYTYSYPEWEFESTITIDTHLDPMSQTVLELGKHMMYYESHYLTSIEAIYQILNQFDLL